MTAEDQEKRAEQRRLMQVMEDLGFPEELGEVLAAQLGGPSSLRRMTGLLLGARPMRFEPQADELVVSLEERARTEATEGPEDADGGWKESRNRNDAAHSHIPC